MEDDRCLNAFGIWLLIKKQSNQSVNRVDNVRVLSVHRRTFESAAFSRRTYFTRAILIVALRRACSVPIRPWRPIAVGFDLPPRWDWTTQFLTPEGWTRLSRPRRELQVALVDEVFRALQASADPIAKRVLVMPAARDRVRPPQRHRDRGL